MDGTLNPVHLRKSAVEEWSSNNIGDEDNAMQKGSFKRLSKTSWITEASYTTAAQCSSVIDYVTKGKMRNSAGAHGVWTYR